ncbi:C40 family peptidase [Nonomuraea sp. NN258]|uniref:C40 family peptidase n=1 Tax=Nonomuraea antri TaxID=2730852 RepID=UPI0015684D43|nr:C40 family peptidase [Nonomuraea antri]NRQ37432.1 C40 family peptidase [Nonomuraea antri]
MNAIRPLLLIAATSVIWGAPDTGPAHALNGCAGPAAMNCAAATIPTGPAGVIRSAAGAIALRAAIEMIGVPYSWGGGGPGGPGYGIGKGADTKGFDCSGLTEYAWARAGVLIGATTREQWRSGIRVPREEIQPGDLVFFDNEPSRPGPEHVGLAVDGERMVDAPYTGANVRIDPLDRTDFMGVVRPGAGRADTGTSEF